MPKIGKFVVDTRRTVVDALEHEAHKELRASKDRAEGSTMRGRSQRPVSSSEHSSSVAAREEKRVKDRERSDERRKEAPKQRRASIDRAEGSTMRGRSQQPVSSSEHSSSVAAREQHRIMDRMSEPKERRRAESRSRSAGMDREEGRVMKAEGQRRRDESEERGRTRRPESIELPPSRSGSSRSSSAHRYTSSSGTSRSSSVRPSSSGQAHGPTQSHLDYEAGGRSREKTLNRYDDEHEREHRREINRREDERYRPSKGGKSGGHGLSGLVDKVTGRKESTPKHRSSSEDRRRSHRGEGRSEGRAPPRSLSRDRKGRPKDDKSKSRSGYYVSYGGGGPPKDDKRESRQGYYVSYGNVERPKDDKSKSKKGHYVSYGKIGGGPCGL